MNAIAASYEGKPVILADELKGSSCIGCTFQRERHLSYGCRHTKHFECMTYSFIVIRPENWQQYMADRVTIKLTNSP